MSRSATGGRITKKFTRIELQSSLRSEVMGASTVCPATSKRSTSPRRRLSVLAIPSSTDASGRWPLNHCPAMMRFSGGWAAA